MFVRKTLDIILRCGAIPLRVVATMVSCVIDATGGNCSSKTDYG